MKLILVVGRKKKFKTLLNNYTPVNLILQMKQHLLLLHFFFNDLKYMPMTFWGTLLYICSQRLHIDTHTGSLGN